eukprot:comp19886_c0_seq1/m.24069 comp19886_c0_seq1/g.24069  ORF comp19886_c0_seq1/g.24069 comp19886_c0_seq1/m.24069 type:complete len:502 (-) comp19886_c0_seq1:39-1544(-)
MTEFIHGGGDGGPSTLGSNQVLRTVKVTWLLVFSACTAAMGASFQYGYAVGVVNNTVKAVQTAFGCKEDCGTPGENWSWAVSIWALGGLMGGCLGGIIADRVGRKRGLIFNNVFFIVGSILQVAARNWGTFMTGRVLVGVGSGIGTIIVPMYVSEISPVHVRGALGTLHQLGITIGIFLPQLLSINKIMDSVDPVNGWMYVYGLALLLAVITSLMFLICPESPHFLYSRHNKDKAAQNLRRLRGTDDIMDELRDMEEELHTSLAVERMSWGQVFSTRWMIRPLIIGLGLQVCQQLSGINSIFFYSTSILKDAHIISEQGDPSSVEMAKQVSSSLLALMNVLFTFLAVALMDRLGRRALLLFGFTGQCLFYVLLTLSFTVHFSNAGYLSVTAMVGAIFTFAVGPGPIPWLITAEIFPMTCREKAMSLSTSTNWLMTFVIGRFFPTIQHALKDYTFALFAVLCFLFAAFSFVMVPETKGKTMEEIHELFEEPNGEANETTRLL